MRCIVISALTRRSHFPCPSQHVQTSLRVCPIFSFLVRKYEVAWIFVVQRLARRMPESSGRQSVEHPNSEGWLTCETRTCSCVPVTIHSCVPSENLQYGDRRMNPANYLHADLLIEAHLGNYCGS